MEAWTGLTYHIFGMCFDQFLKVVKPKHIKEINGGCKKYFISSSSKNKKKRKQPEYDTRNDQRFKCINCDANDSVMWDGEDWVCRECQEINDYPK